MTGSDRLVLYVQPTLGPAHFARVRALAAVPGYRCLGVQLASAEATRRYAPSESDAGLYTTVMTGTYEALPRRELLRRARELVDETGPDAIIIDQPADPVQYRLARHARRRGAVAFTRWATTWENQPRRAWKERLKRLVYRRWDGYLATGERACRYLDTLGVPASRVFTCGNPVDVESLEAIRIRRGDLPREPGFLYVGRFLPYKNVLTLARGYKRYRDSGGAWSLTLVGFGEQWSTVAEVLEGVPGVEMPGHLQLAELAELYACRGALVLCSNEPWGLVVNEAMHMGMPVLLAHTVGCVPELLDEGRNGYALDGSSEESIASAMRRVEKASPEERASMSRASLEIVSSHRPERWASSVAGGLETAWRAHSGAFRR